MSQELLTIERVDGVVWLTLQRGERNLLDVELTRQLAAAVQQLGQDPSVTALVLTGAGDAFCAGADGQNLRETGTAKPFATAVVDLFDGLAKLPFPVIAAVNGDALAGGFGLACSADLILMVESATIGTLEAAVGSWPVIAQVPASKRVAPKLLLRNALTGIPFTSAEALQGGVVDEVLPSIAAVRARAAAVATQVGRGGRAVALGRPALVELVNGKSYRAELEQATAGFVELFTS